MATSDISQMRSETGQAAWGQVEAQFGQIGVGLAG